MKQTLLVGKLFYQVCLQLEERASASTMLATQHFCLLGQAIASTALKPEPPELRGLQSLSL